MRSELAVTHTAVVLTALAVEFDAVVARLGELREEVHDRGTVYDVGSFTGASATWTVAVVQTDAGNERAAFEVERAIAHFRPDVALFVGVAGGLKDVRIGDVVAATEIYGYESGADAENFVARPSVGQSTYALIQRAQAEARRGAWKAEASNGPVDQQALVAPVAAGAKVVKSTRSTTYRFLRDTYDRAVAVEMEGRGFLAATHANRVVEALVIRGISDLLDGKAESDARGSQELAARNAAAFAFHVLANFRPAVAQAAQLPPQAKSAGAAALQPATAPGVAASGIPILDGFVDAEGGFPSRSGLGGIGVERLLVAPLAAFSHPAGARLRAPLEEAARAAAGSVDRFVAPFLIPKTFDWLLDWEPRGSTGWKAGHASTDFHYLRQNVLVASTYNYGDSGFSSVVTLSVVGDGDGDAGRVAFEHIWVAETLGLLLLVGAFYAGCDDDLPLRVDLNLSNLEGSVSWKSSRGRAFHPGQSRISDNSYEERVITTAGEIARDPRTVVRALFDRLFVSFLGDGDDIVTDIAQGRTRP